MAVVGKITGDGVDFTAKQKDGVTLHNFPEVAKTELASVGSVINDAAVSGKRLGAHIMGVTRNGSGVVTSAILFVASGSAPASPWALVANIVGNGGTTVTPA